MTPKTWTLAGLLAAALAQAPDGAKKPEEDPDAIFLLCARDGAENRLSRLAVEKWKTASDLPKCAGGDHPLDKVKCPKDGAENPILEAGGARREQCLKDGASLVLLPVDRGPAKLDEETLKSMPDDIRPRYELMSQRCSKCHTLARPINSAGTRIKGEDWQKYIKRMLRRPGSGITEEEGKKIYGVLKWWSKERAARLERGGKPAGGEKKDGE